MPVNTGPDINTYGIPEVSLSNTFNAWRDISNISAYKLNKLKIYEGLSTASIDTTTTVAGVLQPVLLPTVLSGHTFAGGIAGTTATFSGLLRANSGISCAGGMTVSGDLAVGGGDITTSSTTASLFNTNVTNLSIGGAATGITIGSSSPNSITTIQSALTYLYGNITVGGSASSFNTTNLFVEDTVFTLGVCGGVGVTLDQSRDRGVEFYWYDNSFGQYATLGFFGFDRSTENFTFYSKGVTSPNGIYSGVTGTFQGNFLGGGITATNLYVNSLGTFIGGITTSGVTATTVTATSLSVLGAATVNRMILGSASTGGIVMNVKGKTKYTPGNTFGTPDAAYTNSFREYKDLLHIQLTSGTTYGMLVLELPGEPDYTFINLYLSGYNYTSGAHWKSVISGYAYPFGANGWLHSGDMSVNSSGTVPFNTVRFGQKAAATGSGSRVILLGVTGDQSTLWSYADISIDRLKLSYSGADHVAWERGITASFVHYQSTTSLGLSGGLTTVPWYGLNGYSAGNYGIGTVTPTALLEVAGTLKSTSLTTGGITATTLNASSLGTFVGGITASGITATTVNVQTSLQIAPNELYTTQRTFTQSFNAIGSGTSGYTVVGDAWLIGSFSDPNSIPAQFKFVHNTHTGNNLQSDLYEWARHYYDGAPATVDTFSEWVELPVSISIAYAATRQFRFDVRKKLAGEMQLRMRATPLTAPLSASSGTHYFTFTTTGSTIFTPAAGGAPTTLAAPAPTGFHGRQSYEFPVSKGNYGFAGSTAGLFILNNGNVGIGIITPTVALDVVGAAKIKKEALAGTNLSDMNLLSKYSLVLDATTANGSGAVSYNGAGIAFASNNTTLPLASIFYGGGGVGGSLNFATSETYGNGLNKIGMTIQQGRVGIGTLTPTVALDVAGAINASTTLSSNSKLIIAPQQFLAAALISTDTTASIVGSSYTAGNFNGTLGLYGTNGLAVGNGGGIMFGGAYNNSNLNLLTAWAEISGVRENSTDGSYDGALVFKTRPSGGNPFERVRITSTGKVGIGTSSPQGKLEVSNGAIYVNNGSIDGTYGDQIFFGAAPSGYGTTYLHKIKTSHSAALANSLMTFSLDNAASTFVDVLTLVGSGRVGIGTTTPKGKLHCIGEGFFDYTADGAQGGGLRLTSNSNASSMAVNEYYDGTNLKFARTGGASSIRMWETNNSIGGQIDFQVGKTGAANSVISYETAMMIAANKKVGIGTGTPLAVLDVRGPTVTSNATMNHYTDLVAGSIQGGIQAAQPNGGATGACQIILPYGLTAAIAGGTITPYGGDVMLRIKIMGHQYRNSASTYGASWEVIVHGYFGSSYNAWSGDDNSVVEIRGNAPFSRVRLANKTNASTTSPGKAVILLGDDTTTWKVSDVGTVVQVTDVWTHYGNSTNWADGWVIENPLVPQTYISANYVAAMTVTPKLYQYMDMDGNLGLGTTGPTVKLDVVGGIKASTTLNVLGLGTFVGGITASGITATTLNVLGASNHTGLGTFVGGITASGITATTLNVLGLGTFVGGITTSGVTATTLNVLGLGTFVGGITTSGITATTLNVQGLGTFVGGITASGVTATTLNVQGLGTFVGGITASGVTATTLNVLGASNHTGLGTFVGGITASGVTATTLNVLGASNHTGLGTFVGGITASGVTATTLNVLGASNHTGLGTFVGGITASGVTATNLNVLNTTTLKDLFVSGNLTFGGTASLINIQSTNVNVADTIIVLGSSGGVGITGDTTNDRGIAFFWNANAAAGSCLGFFGFDRATQNFVFYTSGATTGGGSSGGVTGTFQGNFLGDGITATTLNVQGLGTFVGGITASGVTATTLNVQGLGTFVGGITASGVTATTLNVQGLGTFVGGITASGVTATTLNVLGAANVNRMILGSASTGGIVMNVKGKTKYTPGNTFGTPDAAYTNNFREYKDLLHIQLTSGTTYGMLVLELPGEPEYTFINLYLSGYNYVAGQHWESVISGYAYADGANGWVPGNSDNSVQSSGTVPFNTVRFGQKAAATGSGSRVILLGVTGDQSTLWSFADISIDRLKLSYSGADHVAWERGITASFVHYQSTTSLGLSGGLLVVPWDGLNGYSAGNYGIGTVTPTALLEVAGTLKSTSFTTGAITATTLNASSLGTFVGGITTSGVTATTLNVLGASNLTNVRFHDTDRSHFVGFQAPSTVASNITWILPGVTGASGTVIGTDANQNLSWILPAVVAGSDKQVMFNDAGSLAGNAGFVYNKTTFTIGVSAGIGFGTGWGATLSVDNTGLSGGVSISTKGSTAMYWGATGSVGLVGIGGSTASTPAIVPASTGRLEVNGDIRVAKNGFFVNPNMIITGNCVIGADENAIFAGALTIASGQTLSVGSGGSLIIL